MDRFNSNEEMEATPLSIAKDIIYSNGTMDEKVKQIESAITEAKNLAISVVSRCASQVPSNWVDPMLTGETKALTGEAGKWGCPDIESLLNAIRKKIESVADEHCD